MNRRNFLKTLGVYAVASKSIPNVTSSQSSTPSRPNIVIMFVDDMGFSDIGCYGGEIDTPNLNKLAKNGVRFSQFYNTARCCPARASLLTGLYPHQAGVGMMVYRNYGEGYQGNINNKCVTFAEVLKSSGYQTMMVGKWHAGHEPYARPEVRGFERFTGIYPHIDSYWKVLSGCDIYRDKELLIPAGENPVNPYRPDEEFYTTDFFTDNAIDYVDQALTDESKPFLLHVCYNVPHFPLEAPDHLIEKYRGKYKKGWDVLRSEKLERMKKMGIMDKNQQLPKAEGFELVERKGFDFKPTMDTGFLPQWDTISEEDQDELDFRRAMYAAQVDRLDQNVGRIVDHLNKRGVLDNTIILFFSDNGCSGELGQFGMNWGKYTHENYSEWRKTSGWSISQGQCWASYSNTPLRKFKIFVHEGGISTPLIAHWPSGIKKTGRIIDNQMFHLIDVMPTLCEAAGATYPERFEGREITPAQGKSMLAFIKNPDTESKKRTLYWQHETHAAIREGNWKLVTSNDRDENGWELYDLSTDRSESKDLSSENEQKANQLKEKWHQWARETNVLPFPEDRGNLKRVPWPPKPWPEEMK